MRFEPKPANQEEVQEGAGDEDRGGAVVRGGTAGLKEGTHAHVHTSSVHVNRPAMRTSLGAWWWWTPEGLGYSSFAVF